MSKRIKTIVDDAMYRNYLGYLQGIHYNCQFKTTAIGLFEFTEMGSFASSTLQQVYELIFSVIPQMSFNLFPNFAGP